MAQRGELAYTQLKYLQAGECYQQAAQLLTQGNEEDKAHYLNEAGLSFKIAGLYEQALPLYLQTLSIREQMLGKQHPDYATSLNNLAELYKVQDQYEQALPLCQQALNICEQVLGQQHPDYAESLNNLAGLYYAQSQYEQALPLYQQAIDILIPVLGEQHPNTKTVMNNYQICLSAPKPKTLTQKLKSWLGL